MWMGPNWGALLFSVFPPLLCDKSGLQVTDWAKVWDISSGHTCSYCHLSWEQPFKSVHFYILPLPQYSDQILTTVAYIILNWMKIEKQPGHSACSTTCSHAQLMTFHKATWDLRWPTDISHFNQPIGCSEKFTLEILRILFWFCKIFRKCRVQCW